MPEELNGDSIPEYTPLGKAVLCYPSCCPAGLVATRKWFALGSNHLTINNTRTGPLLLSGLLAQ